MVVEIRVAEPEQLLVSCRRVKEVAMPQIALVLVAVFFALAFGLRGWLQWRRTGSTGFRGISGAAGSAEWWGGVLFVAALAGVVAAPVAAVTDLARPWPALDGPAARAAGLALAVTGTAGTLWAQLDMGDSWRIGVDDGERTTLVTGGPFRLVRNPIFTFMTVGLGGIALLTPNAIAAATLLLLVVAVELQVRLVEEPYLLRTHGAPYRAYAGRVGRFVPGLGRLVAHGGAAA
jgi:protein-S-isoprenylcysteine O-methyltransferase Ste14